MAEWSPHRTRNPADPGSSPALATCWICPRSSLVQILGHAYNSQVAASYYAVGVFNPVTFHLNHLFLELFECSACKLAV